MSNRAGYLILAAVVLGVSGVSWGQKASAPNPADGATDVVTPLLRWTAGSTAAMHNVYLGTTPDLGPEHLVAERLPKTMTVYWHVAGIVPGTTYYWRVDEIELDQVTIHTGDVWSFLAQPLTAFMPDPADGSNTVAVAPELTWLAGQGALKHQVYLSDSEAAVTDGTAEADKGVVDDTSFAPGELQPASTYFWRVDEIGPGDVAQAGPVWTFITVLPVDDMESYTVDEGARIYETWIDGYTDGLSGSIVGYIDAPFVETATVHGGAQAMPFDYNNVNPPFFSQTYREFSPAADWTANDVNMLTLFVRSLGADFEIGLTTKAPVIDAQMDDVWASAAVLPIRTTIDGTPVTVPADCSGQFRVLYDNDNLYAFVDVNDDSLNNDSGSSYLDDSVEFYVDGDNTKAGPGLTGNARQYTFGWTTTDIQGTNTNLTGVEHAQVNTPTGWRIEMKFPWQSLMGTNAPVGKLIGIDCFLNDDDNGADTRESQVAWHSLVGNDWQTAASWGTALVAAPSTGGGADSLYVILEDTSNRKGTVVYPDQAVLKAKTWVEWQMPLSEFADAGVRLSAVRRLYLGVGDPANPVAGQAGLLVIDDIYLTRPAPAQE